MRSNFLGQKRLPCRNCSSAKSCTHQRSVMKPSKDDMTMVASRIVGPANLASSLDQKTRPARRGMQNKSKSLQRAQNPVKEHPLISQWPGLSRWFSRRGFKRLNMQARPLNNRSCMINNYYLKKWKLQHAFRVSDYVWLHFGPLRPPPTGDHAIAAAAAVRTKLSVFELSQQ